MKLRFQRSLACFGAAFLVATGFVAGCASPSPSYQGQRAFGSPDDAARALVVAANTDDTETLEALFGPGGREVLSSGDAVADRHGREVFSVAAGEAWRVERIDSKTRELIIGHEEWPFPIPLVKDANGWWFDAEAGKQEVLARRIGRNELAVIGVLRTYAISQREYASVGHDGKPAGIYARKVRSDPGTHNGLYWPVRSPDETPSPLSELAAGAEAEGYSPGEQEGTRPFHGYFFRILTAQGAGAPGGAKSYIVGAEMTDGFAMVAFPAEYLNSGVMTFLIGPDGVVYEKDLGQATDRAARAMREFDPAGWVAVSSAE